jgi:gamma-glutamylcyclotransferase (GGCT)/AIG2-like uncharacterized protein YtfP
MSAVNVFTYGSLMFAPVWEQVCAGRYATQKMVLKDFQRYCIKNESYPAVVPLPGASVEGLVYLHVSDADRRKLDQFEGAEYVVRQQEISGIVVVFYEFVALDRLDYRDWSPSDFEHKGLPTFLARHVGGFLENGSRG